MGSRQNKSTPSSTPAPPRRPEDSPPASVPLSAGGRSGSGGSAAGDAGRSRAAPTRHLEIETKLEIAADAPLPSFAGRRSLTGTGLVGTADPVLHELDAVYFDTAEYDLLRSKLTLRRRSGGEDAGWHLKLPAVAGARTEIGLPLDVADDDPFAATVPAALADLVLGAARGRPLQPVARIRNRRTVRRLLGVEGTPLIEVADDQVTASRLAPTDGGVFAESDRTQWRELEVEVLAGDRTQLAAVVTALQNAGATPASSASKLARALGDQTPPARKSKSAGTAVVAALSKLRDGLIGADRALREGTDVALHDARAAARRIRSVLSVYSPLFAAGTTRQLRGELQQFGAVLGHARDLEVLRRRLRAQLVEEPAEYAEPAAQRIEAEFARVMPVALADVAEEIRSAGYLAMLRELDSFIAAPPYSRRGAKPATSELATLLVASWRTLGGLADQALADPFDNPVIHEVRKGAKALRYASEAAAATLGENTVVFAAAIEEIQEVLGEHQDALTTAAWLAQLALRPDTDGTSGFVFGRLHAFEQAVAHGTLDDFSDAWDRVEDGELLAEAFGR
ncbi:CYTH domain-containing protein [Nakamurella panacisegetis]|uniref:CYTH domain-containing protein n=1 Tax=Nakamurella panacisegetis TaxID=1090615 RepID=A0A1H0JUP6_9ACTN|nr:CYTH and CHAD domain-containing protein [Nakamurella panacisegetis]SDO47446.1 CYTH domain-containing protein [Nakamurella panacisegetis]